MHQDHGEREQQRDVQGEKFVFFEIFARVIGAINGGHEVRIVENEGERVESDDPSVGMRGRHPHGHG